MRTRLVVLVVIWALALPSAAAASSVSMPHVVRQGSARVGPQDLYRLSVATAAGEANRIQIDGVDPREGIRVTDKGAPLSAGENCRADGDGVLCSVQSDIPSFLMPPPTIDLGDGDDELTITGFPASVLGGAGNDRISLPNHLLVVDGGPGADSFRALGGSVTYVDRTAGVSVTPDGVANDGEPGEGDDVGPTFARITGGRGDDQLHAAGQASQLDGRAGNDRIFGGPGNDELTGGHGADSLLGGDGGDALWGGPDADLLRGGGGDDSVSFASFSPPVGIDVTLDDRPGDGAPGENDDIGSDVESVLGTPADDRIVGSDGPNGINGGGGSDYVDGAGGADRLSGGAGRIIGGPGADSLFASGGSAIEARDGERDEIFCGGKGNTYAMDPFDALMHCTPAPIKPEPSTIRVRRDGTMLVNVRCTYGSAIDEPCVGKLYAYPRGAAGRGAPLARGRFALPPWTERSPSSVGAEQADPVRAVMRLTRSARGQLARKRRLFVSLEWRAYSESPPEATRGEYELKLLAPLRRGR